MLKSILPSFLLSWYHFLLSFLGAVLYGFPSKNLILIGVTGTNGKSTTCEMIANILEEAGYKTALLSSIHFQIGGHGIRNTLKMTMPGRFFIQRFLRKAADEGCTHAVLEVTSEGILQHRHRFLRFHTAVLTNISPEHIERHGSFENYLHAKGELFGATKEVHVVNGEDKYAYYFLQFPSRELCVYSFASDLEVELPSGSSTSKIEGRFGDNQNFFLQDMEFRLQLLGKFQAYNALAAISAALAQGVSLEICKSALEKMNAVPGRMEQIAREPFSVIVDYAFTPVALEQVYESFRSSEKFQMKNAKLICVLGAAGGGRDVWKRPVLGGIAADWCDFVIVTNEDPYEENLRTIMEQVAHGARKKNKGSVEVIEDRREAIRRALSLAKIGDVVVITGKGSEDSIAMQGGKKIPWDDRGVAREEFEKLMDKTT